MKRSVYRRLGLVLLFACLSAGVISAQENSQAVRSGAGATR